MSKQEKANIWLGKLARSYIMWSYRRQVCSRRRANPELYPPCSPEVESRHRALWSSLHKNASCEWLRFFSHASGLEDFRYVPEDIYYGIIEPIFNDTNYSWVIADKNFYDMRFDATLFPETVLRNVAGDFLDHDFNLLTPAQARSLLESQHRDLVIKPSLDSGGGKNVAIIRYRDGKHFAKDGGGISCDGILNKWGGGNFVVQERISQHPFFSGFNPASVNTIRVFTYRAPLSEQVVVLKSLLRMGNGENDVDNENAGGISVGVLPNGMLNSYACSKYGNKHLQHPSSQKIFASNQVPCLDRILVAAQKLALNTPSQRFLSFDLTIDHKEQVKVLEVNTSGQGLLFLQTFGGSLFSERTEEIIEYCATHEKQSQFKHLRLIA